MIGCIKALEDVRENKEKHLFVEDDIIANNDMKKKIKKDKITKTILKKKNKNE